MATNHFMVFCWMCRPCMWLENIWKHQKDHTVCWWEDRTSCHSNWKKNLKCEQNEDKIFIYVQVSITAWYNHPGVKLRSSKDEWTLNNSKLYCSLYNSNSTDLHTIFVTMKGFLFYHVPFVLFRGDTVRKNDRFKLLTGA